MASLDPVTCLLTFIPPGSDLVCPKSPHRINLLGNMLKRLHDELYKVGGNS